MLSRPARDLVSIIKRLLANTSRSWQHAWKLTYSGGDRYEKGIGIMVYGEAVASFKGKRGVSNRSILVKLLRIPMDINVIQVYASTTDAYGEDIKEFYDVIDNVLKSGSGVLRPGREEQHRR